MIRRIGFRELKRTWGRALLLGLLLALTAGLLGGGFLATESLYNTRDAVSERLHLADLSVEFVPATPSEMPAMDALRDVDGVERVNRRYISYGFIERANDEPFPVLIVYLSPDDHPTVNDVQVLDGDYLDPGRPEQALVHRSFAKKDDVGIDSTLVVNPTTFPTEFTVAGVGQSPEFLIPTANPNTLIPSKGSLGIIYASRAKLDQTFVDTLYNRLAFRYAADADPQAVKSRILAALSGLEIESVQPRSQNFGYRYLTEDLKGFYVFFPTVAGIFALLACIVIFVTIRRLLSNRQREIGSIEAMGFSPRSIAGGYLIVTLAPAIPAALLGAAASVVFGQYIAAAYADVVGLPDVVMVYPWWAFAVAIVSALVVAIVGTLWPLRRLFDLEPLEALRGRGSVQFGPLPDAVERVVQRLLPTNRLSFRNLFRRFGMTLATVLLVALAIGLPASVQSAFTSWIGWIDQTMEAQEYDLMVAFKVPVDSTYARRVSQTEGVADVTPYLSGYGEVTAQSGEPTDMRIVGKPAEAHLQKLPIMRGRWFASDDSREIVVNKNDLFGGLLPPVGDDVTVEVDSTEHRLNVAGWANEISIGTVYVPLETARTILDKPGELTGFAVRIDEGASLGAVRDRLLSNEVVANVQGRVEIANAMKEYMSSFDVIIDPLIGISVLLSVLFLATVLSILLLERDDEYATLRAMGVSGPSLFRMVGIEVGVVTLVATLLSVAVWVGLAAVFRYLMALAWLDAGLRLVPGDFLTVAIPAVVFLLVAAVPGAWRLLHIDLTRSLHQRAFG